MRCTRSWCRVKRVDVFDTATWKWTKPAVLSEARQWLVGASDGNGRAYFAGGFTCEDCAHKDRSATVDVFDASTGRLRIVAARLGQARSNLGAAGFAGGWVVFAGGNARMSANDLLEDPRCRTNCRGKPESGALDPDDTVDANPRNRISLPPGFTLKGKPASPKWPLGCKGHRVDALCGAGDNGVAVEVPLLPARASPGVAAHAWPNGTVTVAVAGGEGRTKWRVPMKDGLVSDFVLDRIDTVTLPPCRTAPAGGEEGSPL